MINVIVWHYINNIKSKLKYYTKQIRTKNSIRLKSNYLIVSVYKVDFQFNES